MYLSQQEQLQTAQPSNLREAEDVSVGDYQTLMQSTHLSLNHFQLNSDGQLKLDDFNGTPNQLDHGDAFETANISKYLGHNLKSSEILMRPSALEAQPPDSHADISDSLPHTHFNNQSANNWDRDSPDRSKNENLRDQTSHRKQ